MLVVIAVRHIRARSKPKPPKKPPKWQEHVDSMSPWFALVLAPTLQPWALIGAGAATVVEAKLSSWESFLALFLYCVLASSSYLAMEIYAVARPAKSQAMLGGFRSWIDAHTDQAIIVGSLILGLWLIAKDIYLIVSRLPEIKEHRRGREGSARSTRAMLPGRDGRTGGNTGSRPNRPSRDGQRHPGWRPPAERLS